MISVLIPYHRDSPERERNLDFVLDRWSRTNAEVIVGECEPFSVSRAVNQAFRRSNGNNILMWGADHIPPEQDRLNRLEGWLESHQWTSCYAGTHELSKSSTEVGLSGDKAMGPWMEGLQIPMCVGIMGMRRSAFTEAGRMDEGFEGWGYEDTTMRLILSTLFGDCHMPHWGILTGLWHPQQPRGGNDNNRLLHEAYVALAAEGKESMYDFIHGDAAAWMY